MRCGSTAILISMQKYLHIINYSKFLPFVNKYIIINMQSRKNNVKRIMFS